MTLKDGYSVLIVDTSFEKENKMNKTYYIGLNICRFYIVHINDDGYEQKEWVPEDDINGFIQCLKALGCKEI